MTDARVAHLCVRCTTTFTIAEMQPRRAVSP